MGRAQGPRERQSPDLRSQKPSRGPQQSLNRRRSARLRQPQAFSLSPRLQAEGQRLEHHRIQIGEIFGEIKNKIQSGYNLREIIDHIDELRFRSQTEKHELSHLYEAKIKNMGTPGAAAASITRPALSFARPSHPAQARRAHLRRRLRLRRLPQRILRVSEIPRERQS